MISRLLIQLLLCSLWGILKTSALLRLTSSPLFAMDTLNGVGTEETKQTLSVLFDLGTTETDTVTDGGTQESPQSSVTSTVTPALNNVTDGVENNILLQALTPTSIDPRQSVSLDVSNLTNNNNAFPVLDSASKENKNNVTLTPLLQVDNTLPYEDQFGPFLKIPTENNTTGKECFCTIPGPTGQKGNRGEKGDPGDLGITGGRGPQGFKGAKGGPGQEGTKGDKGNRGEPGRAGLVGPKGEPGDLCSLCEKGGKGTRGPPGIDGIQGLKGMKGEPGLKGEIGSKGNPGEKGPQGSEGLKGNTGEKGHTGLMGPPGLGGPKGDRGFPGNMGPSGIQGPPGIPGRKGEKGQRGGHTEHDNTAFSVGLKWRKNALNSVGPLIFDKIYVNENNVYNVNSGIFVASIDGIYFFKYQLSILHSQSISVGLFLNGQKVLQTQARPYEQGVCQTSGSLLLHLHEDDEVWIQVLSGIRNVLIPDDNTDSVFLGFLLYPIED